MSVTITIIASACDAAKESSRQSPGAKPFTILEASFENWHAGRPEGGSGTDYRFTTVINTNQPIQFDSVWVREKGLTLPLTPVRFKGPATNKPFTFSQSDTIVLFATTAADFQTQQKQAALVNNAAQAILSYRVDGKKGHEAIPALNQKESDPRPQH